MNNKLILGVIIIVAIVGGFVLMGGKKTQTENNPTQMVLPTGPKREPTFVQVGETISVEVTDSGFLPASLTVKLNTRVKWTNKTDKAISINSDDHPTHKLYPKINLSEVLSGTSVSTIFDKSGTYTYHDHYNPTRTGKIVVE